MFIDQSNFICNQTEGDIEEKNTEIWQSKDKEMKNEIVWSYIENKNFGI